jgi:hypothetical protein
LFAGSAVREMPRNLREEEANAKLPLFNKTWRQAKECNLPQRMKSACHRDRVSGCACPELEALKRQYEFALRIWGEYEFPFHNEPIATRARRSVRLQLKQNALVARNEANDSLLDHKLVCLLCAE